MNFAYNYRIKDPSSVQIDEARYVLKDNNVTVYFDFFARNGFGGFNRKIAELANTGRVYITDDSSDDVPLSNNL